MVVPKALPDLPHPLECAKGIVAKVEKLAANIEEVSPHVSKSRDALPRPLLMLSAVESACFGRESRPSVLGDVLIESEERHL